MYTWENLALWVWSMFKISECRLAEKGGRGGPETYLIPLSTTSFHTILSFQKSHFTCKEVPMNKFPSTSLQHRISQFVKKNCASTITHCDSVRKGWKKGTSSGFGRESTTKHARNQTGRWDGRGAGTWPLRPRTLHPFVRQFGQHGLHLKIVWPRHQSL